MLAAPPLPRPPHPPAAASQAPVSTSGIQGEAAVRGVATAPPRPLARMLTAARHRCAGRTGRPMRRRRANRREAAIARDGSRWPRLLALLLLHPLPLALLHPPSVHPQRTRRGCLFRPSRALRPARRNGCRRRPCRSGYSRSRLLWRCRRCRLRPHPPRCHFPLCPPLPPPSLLLPPAAACDRTSASWCSRWR